MRAISFISLALVLSTTGCMMAAQEGPGAVAASATPTDRAGYVAMAGSSDLYEIQSSQMAMQKAQRADVRELAQMLIQDHTQTTAQVMAAARASGMNPPPPALLPPQAAMLADLQRADAAGFDQIYLSQQATAHSMALALHQNYAARGDTPALKTVAASAVPIIQMHIQHVQMLRR